MKNSEKFKILKQLSKEKLVIVISHDEILAKNTMIISMTNKKIIN